MSHPDIDPDDPRLTAYALGELPDAAEREAVESLLAASAAARAEIEQIRLLARTLTAEFDRERQEYVPGHSSGIEPTNLIPFPTPTQRHRTRWSAALLKIAATLMILASLAAWEAGRPRSRPPSQVAVSRAGSPAGARPIVVPAPDDPRTFDRVVAVPPAAPSEKAAAEPMLAREKPAAGLELDKAAEDSAGRGDVPSAAVPAAAPPASTPMLAMGAPARRSVELPKPALPGAAASGTASKRKEDTARAQTPSSSVGDLALDRATTGGGRTFVGAPHEDHSAVERRLAASFVRVQEQNGKTTAGVVVAPVGVILTLGSVGATNGYHPIMVVLRDGSTFKVASMRRLSGSGLLALRIEANDLVAASPGGAAASDAGGFLVASPNTGTGEVTFGRGESISPLPSPADQPTAAGSLSAVETDPVNFVFDSAGGFLGVSYNTGDARKAARAKSPPAFRPLTAADREELGRLISDDRK